LDLPLRPLSHEIGELLEAGLDDVRSRLHVSELDHDRLLGLNRTGRTQHEHDCHDCPKNDPSLHGLLLLRVGIPEPLPAARCQLAVNR
jgi:hypothetical protein